MLKDYMPDKAGPNDYLRTCNILTYELGRMVRAFVYMQYARQARDVTYANIRKEEARIELADLITQCRVVAEQMGWDESELRRDGEARFKVRMIELREGLLK